MNENPNPISELITPESAPAEPTQVPDMPPERASARPEAPKEATTAPETPSGESQKSANRFDTLFQRLRKPGSVIYSDSKKAKKKNIFFNNYFLLAFSVFVAFAIWVGISFSDTTTEISRTIRGVTLEYTNLPDSVSQLGLQVIDGSQSITSVDVTVTGKQYMLSQISADDLTAYIKLSDVTAAGTYTAEIKVSATGKYKDFKIDSVDPQIANVRLDRVTTKEYSLEIETNSYSPSDGYTLKIPTLSDTTVMITGPASDIQQIAKIVAVAEVPETIRATGTYPAVIKIYDEYGAELTNLAFQKSISETELTIVAMRLKTVPIDVNYLNAPFSVNANIVSITPKTVDVSVPSDLYDSLTSLLVGSLDFSKVNTSNTQFNFDIDSVLPSGCTNESGVSGVTVSVNLAGMRTREFDVSNIKVISTLTNKKVDVLTQSVHLTITGPAEEIEQITANEITVEVDMTSNQNSIGKHEIPVSVSIVNGASCWVYGSPTVFVQIDDAPASSGASSR